MIVRVTATRAKTGSRIVSLHRVSNELVSFYGPNRAMNEFARATANGFSCFWMLEFEVATEHEFAKWSKEAQSGSKQSK